MALPLKAIYKYDTNKNGQQDCVEVEIPDKSKSPHVVSRIRVNPIYKPCHVKMVMFQTFPEKAIGHRYAYL